MSDAVAETGDVSSPNGGNASKPAARDADLRRRLLRHYLPIFLTSAAMLVLFMEASPFDTNKYPPPGDIFTEGAKGAIPDGEYPIQTGKRHTRGQDATPPMQDGGGQGGTPSTDPPAGHTGPPPGGHGVRQTTSPSTSPTGAHTGPPGGDQDANPPGNPSSRPGGYDTGGSEAEHAGDTETVLRMRRFATATGYLALALLGLTLLIGPANLVLRRRNPLSSYVRRDIGIATAIVGVAHVVFGFLVKHGDGQILGYFFQPGDRTRILTNSFGLGNWTGLAALLIVGLLAAISSGAALRKLKAKRWKRLQRLNYALFALVILHALFYGALWRDTSPYTVVLGIAFVLIVVVQLIGVRLWRKGTPVQTAQS